MATPELLRTDAAWIWFGAPKAVRVDTPTGDYTFIGWAATDGTWVGRRDNQSGDWTEFHLHTQVGPYDDHDVASIGVRADGRIIVAYSEHNDSEMRCRISDEPYDITTMGSEFTVATGGGNMSYPNLVYLSAEARWYMVLRDAPDMFFVTSDDDGVNWSAMEPLIAVNGERPYVQISSNGVDRIDVLCTDGHPSEVTTNSVYHFYYDAGVWRNSAGLDIGAAPIAHADMTVIHDDTVQQDNAWVWDICLDDTGMPTVVYDTMPDVSNDHRYWYGRWNGASWDTQELAAAGRMVAAAGDQPYYSAGIAIDHDDPRILWLATPGDATEVWDLEQWTTADHGATWASTTVVADGAKNLRPTPIRGGSPAVVYFNGRYDDYDDFDCSMYLVEQAAAFPAPPDAPEVVAVAVVRTAVVWLGCDLITGRVIARLPDVVGRVSRLLGAWTSAQLQLPIPVAGHGSLSMSLVEQATDPGRTLLVAVINDVPQWGGIPLFRRGGSGGILELAAVTCEGYLDRRYVADHTYTQQDQASVIAAGLAGDANTTEGIGLTVDAPATGVLRDRTYLDADDVTVYRRLQELMAVDGGPEWTVDLDWTDTNHVAVAKILRIRSRIGIASATPRAVFSSTGDASAAYSYEEDYTAGRGANHVTATSSGEGEVRPESAPARDEDLLAVMPRYEQRYTPSTSIIETATLDAHAAAELARRRYGSRVWQISARWDAYPRLSVDWALGDDIGWQLTGHRHPDGVTGAGRCVGWELDMPSGLVTPILLDETTLG